MELFSRRNQRNFIANSKKYKLWKILKFQISERRDKLEFMKITGVSFIVRSLIFQKDLL